MRTARPGRFTGRLRLTVRRLGLVATVGLLAVGLAACKDSGGGAAAGPPVDSKAVSANAATLDELYRKITGGVQQRLAGEQVTYHLVRDYVSACMAKLKTTYYPAPFATAYEGLSDADLTFGWDNGGWLGRPSQSDLGVQGSKLSQARAAATNQEPAEVTAMSDAAKAKYGDQLSQCEAPETLYEGKDTAASADDLQDQLGAVVTQVIALPAIQQLTSGYGACLAKAGYANAADPGALQRQIGAKYPALSEAPVNGKAASSAWSAAVAGEAKAAAADKGCRQKIYDAAMTALGAPLAAFTSAQATALDTVTKEWAAIVSAAAKYTD